MMGTMITVCKPVHVPPHRHSSVKLKEKNTVLFIYVCLEIYMYKHISKNT